MSDNLTTAEAKAARDATSLSQPKAAQLLPVPLPTLRGWETRGTAPAYVIRAYRDLGREMKENGMMKIQSKVVVLEESPQKVDGQSWYVPHPPAEGTGDAVASPIDWCLNSYTRDGWRVNSHADTTYEGSPAIRVIFEKPMPASMI